MTRHLAIDWSGAKGGAKKKIWLAEVVDGQLCRLETGRSREEVRDHLIALAASGDSLRIGLDFAFSFPQWFLSQRGFADVREVWSVVADQGEEWLSASPWPFWGKKGMTKKVSPAESFRATEREVAGVNGGTPKSVFQIAGAGAVGTATIRGIPILRDLADASFAIWPFDPVSQTMVIEIYPRLLTGPVVKSDRQARQAYLDRFFPELTSEFRRLAASTEDAFDAAVSALRMSANADEIEALLPAAEGDDARLEGAIWHPRTPLGSVPTTLAVAEGRKKPGCVFCEKEDHMVISRSSRAFLDAFPVTAGHTLVVPSDHVESIFDLSAPAQRDIWELVARVREDLVRTHQVSDFTIGINDGQTAGQTVGHAHIHVIPRRPGDVDDPRGGVRWVIPDEANYWDR